MIHRRPFLQACAGAVLLASGGGWLRPASGAAATKVALVVGNAAYPGSERLNNPVSDARLTAENLLKLGFQTTLVTDRTAVQLKGDLESFGQLAKGADVAVLFYAGHGVAVDSTNYLLPVDQRMATATSVEMKRNGISLKWVEALISPHPRGVALIVLDACRNPLMRGLAQQGMVAGDRPARGTLTLYSTAPGALARDGSGRNSEFSAAFNRHLANPELSVKQIAESTQRDVSAETGDTQVPWIHSGLIGDVRLSSGQVVQAAPAAKAGAARGLSRGAGGEPPRVSTQFWNENLALLEEEMQLAVLNFDVNSRPVLEQRAAAGDVMALTILGSVYLPESQPTLRVQRSGQGLSVAQAAPRNRAAPADPVRAARYLGKAAERRFPIAQTLLAELLVEAPAGVPRDLQRAENLLQDAAATGYGRARLDLLSLRGRRGSLGPQDLLDNAKTLQHYLLRVPGAGG